jgi:peptidoglycan/xylan/chitin deacetylase (PgdA/CDA1 family)
VISVFLAAVVAAIPPAHARRAFPVDRRPVPILMYHVLAPPPADAVYPGLYVRPERFAAEVRLLASDGYRAVTLRRVWLAWHGRARLPRRPIVLSFDDGYRSDYTVALPVLRRYRWPGVLNLELANLRPVWGSRPGEVRSLVRAGWEIDAHTLTHPDLTLLGRAELRRQVAGARLAIRRTFHVPVPFFCYPSGRFDAAVEAEVRRAGYLGATTEQPGLASPTSDPYALDRIRVDGSESPATLLAVLRGLHAG